MAENHSIDSFLEISKYSVEARANLGDASTDNRSSYRNVTVRFSGSHDSLISKVDENELIFHVSIFTLPFEDMSRA